MNSRDGGGAAREEKEGGEEAGREKQGVKGGGVGALTGAGHWEDSPEGGGSSGGDSINKRQKSKCSPIWLPFTG